MIKTDKFGVFDEVYCVVDVTDGTRVSQWYSRKYNAEQRAKGLNWNMNDRFEAVEFNAVLKYTDD